MNEKAEKSNYVKPIIGLIIANAIRLLKIIPNNDPIMSMALPFSRRSSAITSFAFPLATMISFDLVTGYIGAWTIVTSLTYGMLGIFFHYLLKNRKEVDMRLYIWCGVSGVLFFDLITGVIATPLLYPPMSFTQSFLGQIPFTAAHLLTTIGFILVITPLLDKQVLLSKRLDDQKLFAGFRLFYQ